MFPHDWKAGLKRIPLHSLFAAVGVGARFLPPPFGPIAIGGFVIWRVLAERSDYKNGRDTKAKAGIDLASQVGAAIAGALINF